MGFLGAQRTALEQTWPPSVLFICKCESFLLYICVRTDTRVIVGIAGKIFNLTLMKNTGSSTTQLTSGNFEYSSDFKVRGFSHIQNRNGILFYLQLCEVSKLKIRKECDSGCPYGRTHCEWGVCSCDSSSYQTWGQCHGRRLQSQGGIYEVRNRAA